MNTVRAWGWAEVRCGQGLSETHLGKLALGGRRLNGGERLPTWASKGLQKDNIRCGSTVDRKLTGATGGNVHELYIMWRVIVQFNIK